MNRLFLRHIAPLALLAVLTLGSAALYAAGPNWDIAADGSTGTFNGNVVIGGNVTAGGTGTFAGGVVAGPQAANTVQAGPASGGPLTPTFRALVGSDLPSPFTSGTRTGNTSAFVTQNGAATSGSVCQYDAGGNCTAVSYVNTRVATSLGADVTLNSSTYAYGPSVAQGTTGIWLASGTVTLLDSAAAQGYICKLWDGTTVIASSKTTQGASGQSVTLSLSGTLATPAANIRISCQLTVNTATAKIVFNATGASKDSTLTAVLLH
jgi:hypothetical protein